MNKYTLTEVTIESNDKECASELNWVKRLFDASRRGVHGVDEYNKIIEEIETLEPEKLDDIKSLLHTFLVSTKGGVSLVDRSFSLQNRKQLSK